MTICKTLIFFYNKTFDYSISEFNRRTQILPPDHYVYYTWFSPLKSQELTVTCGEHVVTISLDVRTFLSFSRMIYTYIRIPYCHKFLLFQGIFFKPKEFIVIDKE